MSSDFTVARLEELLKQSRGVSQAEKQAYRVAYARGVLAAIPLSEQIGPKTAITEILTDLMHLCDADGLDFEDRLRCARRHYEVEAEGAALEIGGVTVPVTTGDVLLAKRFAAEIRDWYAGDKQATEEVRSRRWSDMLARNRVEFEVTGCYGATNDDFDANEAMSLAWDDVVGVEYDSGSEAHADRADRAWALAAFHEFVDARIKTVLA